MTLNLTDREFGLPDYRRPYRQEWTVCCVALKHKTVCSAINNFLITLTRWRHCCHIGTAIKHPVPDRVKPSFVIFDIRALWRSVLSVRGAPQSWVSECPDVKNYKWRLNPVWHRMFKGCTHMATVGSSKGIKYTYLLQMSIAWYEPRELVKTTEKSFQWNSLMRST